MISAHDESRGESNKGAKMATWNCRIETTAEKMFFANEMALEKYADRFVKVYKLAHLKYSWSKMQGNKPFKPTNPGSKVITSRTGHLSNLHLLEPVKLINCVRNRV